MAPDFGVQRWRPASLQHQQDGRIHRLSGQTMGTHWSLRLANPDYLPTEPVQALLEQVFEDVIAQMSNWEADSLITRFNRSRPGQTHVVPAEFAHVLEAALHWLSGAALDPGMGALVSLGVRAAPEPAAAAFRAGTGRRGDRALAEDQRPRPSALECTNPAVAAERWSGAGFLRHCQGLCRGLGCAQAAGRRLGCGHVRNRR
jgi:hypothetical protein